MKRVSPLLLLIVLMAASQPYISRTAAASSTQNISLVQLIVTPEKFDGKQVSAVGFLTMDHDGDLLYMHEADSSNWILGNAIWIRRSEDMGKNRNVLSGKYVKVTGVFRADYTQQLRYPLGGFFEVNSITLWSDPASPVGKRFHPEQ